MGRTRKLLIFKHWNEFSYFLTKHFNHFFNSKHFLVSSLLEFFFIEATLNFFSIKIFYLTRYRVVYISSEMEEKLPLSTLGCIALFKNILTSVFFISSPNAMYVCMYT